MPFTQDGTITYESFVTKYNADLANTLGNLVNRSIAMTNKYFGGMVKKGECTEQCDSELIAAANDTVERYYALMDAYRNADACEAVMSLAKRCNKYIDETAPWALAKDGSKKAYLENVLYNLLDVYAFWALCSHPLYPKARLR